jgi:hypothetical protein
MLWSIIRLNVGNVKFCTSNLPAHNSKSTKGIRFSVVVDAADFRC